MITFSAFADEIAPQLDVQMDTCQSHGIRCIDVRGIDGKNVSTFTVQQAREYKKQMDGRGFRAACIGSPIGKIRMDEDFAKHLDLLKNCCDVARAFDTKLVRIFSFYASAGKNIVDERQAVMDRMTRMVELAQKEGVTLLHENEKAIYGAKPQQVKDLFATIHSPNFKGIFDPGNFVEEGVAPYDQAWTAGLDSLTDYFHIKDKNPGDHTCIPAGQGQGQIEPIFRDLKARNWSGVISLEPHMRAAGQYSGFTGPQLFAQAVAGLKSLCDKVGLKYE